MRQEAKRPVRNGCLMATTDVKRVQTRHVLKCPVGDCRLMAIAHNESVQRTVQVCERAIRNGRLGTVSHD